MPMVAHQSQVCTASHPSPQAFMAKFGHEGATLATPATHSGQLTSRGLPTAPPEGHGASTGVGYGPQRMELAKLASTPASSPRLPCPLHVGRGAWVGASGPYMGPSPSSPTRGRGTPRHTPASGCVHGPLIVGKNHVVGGHAVARDLGPQFLLCAGAVDAATVTRLLLQVASRTSKWRV